MAEDDSVADVSGRTETDVTNNETTNYEANTLREDGSDSPPQQPAGSEEQGASSKAPPHIPLVPPEDCIAITPDRGVLKKVLEAGEPDTKPSMHARCLVHYVGYLVSNGEKFMDTRMDTETGEPVVVVAGRTASAQETGLCQAAASMCRGERALVYVADPAYGYGAQGSFSFPCVPPHSQLVYEVEMVNWEAVPEDEDDSNRVSLLFEERLERAERRRAGGNELYKEGRYKDALAKYALALSYLDEDFMYQLEGHYLDKAEAVKLRTHLNMAAVQLKTGDYNTAIYNCGQVLALDEKNLKALYRRARARHALGQTDDAERDLLAALKIDPNDQEVRRELAAVRATIKVEKEASKKLWGGSFQKGAAAASAGSVPAAAAATAPEAGGASSSGSPAAAEAKGTGGGAAAAAAGPAKRTGGKVTAAAAGGGAKGPAAARGTAAAKAVKPRAAGLGLLENGLESIVGLLATLLTCVTWLVASVRALRPKGVSRRAKRFGVVHRRD